MSEEATTPASMSAAEKEQIIMARSDELLQEGVSWIVYFRAIFGLDGLVFKHFPQQDDRRVFEATDSYKSLQMALAKLRKGTVNELDIEPGRVVTVRMPKSLHDSLKSEAHGRQTSMNKLCISKLLQAVPHELS